MYACLCMRECTCVRALVRMCVHVYVSAIVCVCVYIHVQAAGNNVELIIRIDNNKFI